MLQQPRKLGSQIHNSYKCLHINQRQSEPDDAASQLASQQSQLDGRARWAAAELQQVAKVVVGVGVCFWRCNCEATLEVETNVESNAN